MLARGFLYVGIEWQSVLMGLQQLLKFGMLYWRFGYVDVWMHIDSAQHLTHCDWLVGQDLDRADRYRPRKWNFLQIILGYLLDLKRRLAPVELQMWVDSHSIINLIEWIGIKCLTGKELLLFSVSKWGLSVSFMGAFIYLVPVIGPVHKKNSPLVIFLHKMMLVS